MSRSKFFSPLLFATLLSTQVQATAPSDSKPNQEEIKIGTTIGLTGLVGPYIKVIVAGMQLAIEKINADGGIHGRKIRQIVLDDGYEGPKALENAKHLVEVDHVFLLLGGAGTASSKAFIPYLASRNVPYLFPTTGGLGFEKTLYNFRVTYLDEAQSLIEFAAKEFKGKTVGVFYQDDAFGTSGRNGVAKVLSKYNQQIAAEAKYDRATGDVNPGVEALIKAKPDIIYLQTLPKQGIEFIAKAAAKGYKPTYLATSILSSAEVIKALGKNANNIFVTENLPLPDDQSFSLVKKFQADIKSAGKPELGNALAFEGYAAATLFAELMRKADKNATRESFMKSIEAQKNFDFEGLPLSFSESKHNGLNSPFIFKLSEGKALMIQKPNRGLE